MGACSGRCGGECQDLAPRRRHTPAHAGDQGHDVERAPPRRPGRPETTVAGAGSQRGGSGRERTGRRPRPREGKNEPKASDQDPEPGEAEKYPPQQQQRQVPAADEERLKADYLAGVKIVDLARRSDSTRQTVLEHVRPLALPPTPPEARPRRSLGGRESVPDRALPCRRRGPVGRRRRRCSPRPPQRGGVHPRSPRPGMWTRPPVSDSAGNAARSQPCPGVRTAGRMRYRSAVPTGCGSRSFSC